MKKLIGIVGLMNSGKGTVSDIIERDYGYRKDSFAAPLKDAAADIFGWNREMLEGATKESREWREQIDPYWSVVLKNPSFTPRLALQLLGTEAGRNVFGENLWTASLIKRYEAYDSGVVVSDTRFVNEIEAIQNAGGIVMRVMRGDDPQWIKDAENFQYPAYREYMTEYYPTVHQSEWDWATTHFDFIIDNDGTLADLTNCVHDIMNVLKQK